VRSLAGPDPDSGHAGQDGVKRVSLHEFDGGMAALRLSTKANHSGTGAAVGARTIGVVSEFDFDERNPLAPG
jgi:hypothetical protein